MYNIFQVINGQQNKLQLTVGSLELAKEACELFKELYNKDFIYSKITVCNDLSFFKNLPKSA